MHVPVMLAECLEYLALRPDGIYLDTTAGLGGHAGAIAQRPGAGHRSSAEDVGGLPLLGILQQADRDHRNQSKICGGEGDSK